MNRRGLLIASLATLPAALFTPANAYRRRPAARRSASAVKPPRRRQGGGLTATHVRTRVVTRTFRSNRQLVIPGFGSGSQNGDPASVYPSVIQVGGFRQGRILKLRVTLIGFSHGTVSDVEVLLVAPGNVGVVILSDTPTALDGVAGINVTFDQDAPHRLPAPLVTGTFQPLNNGGDVDRFPAPAPEGVTGHSLAAFNNRNPNGRWQLFVVDDRTDSDGSDDVGSLDGWSLTIRVRERVPHQHRRSTRRSKR
jgi:hypothetical protein